MWEYTVNVWAKGTPDAPIDVSNDSLEVVYEALLNRGDLLGPAISADDKQRIFVTATVTAENQEEANEHVVGALGDVLVGLGLIQGFGTASHYVTA